LLGIQRKNKKYQKKIKKIKNIKKTQVFKFTIAHNPQKNIRKVQKNLKKFKPLTLLLLGSTPKSSKNLKKTQNLKKSQKISSL
jgi:hypothetical protein